MTRLASEFWVKAYIKRLSLENIPAFVVRHGDDTAGAILVKLATLDGQAKLFQKTFDFEANDQIWRELSRGPEHEVDTVIARQSKSDPDLWVIEIEDAQGRHFLDAY